MKPIKRAIHVTRTSPLSAVSAGAFRLARRAGHEGHVPWAWFGPASRLLAQLVPTRQPAVLVQSLPRSGSSWVSATLGHAGDALYLREPLTQTHVSRQGSTDVIFPIADDAPPEYALAARRAFLGVPDFAPRIVRWPERWSLASRGQRRLVIKEVNPHACAWLMRQHRPRLILLLRHPAAVAHSYHKLGWVRDDPVAWRRLGGRFGAALRAAHDAIAGSPGPAAHRIVLYEALCIEPLEVYRDLYAFAGLSWTPAIADYIEGNSASGDDSEPYSIQRRSKAMVDAWRGQVTHERVAALREGYLAAGLPWYTAEEW